MPLAPRITEVEQMLFCSDVVAIGAFRCPSKHPLFFDSGPASGHLLVFPRSSTTILYDRGGAVTAGPPTAMFYNVDQEYGRRKIDEVDASDWFMIAPDVARDVVARHVPAARGASRVFPFFVAPSSTGVYLEQRRLFAELAQHQPLETLDVEERVIAILDRVVREGAGILGLRPERKGSRVEGSVETVKAVIAHDPSANVTLRSLATAAGCSPFHLCRLFQRSTGGTITSYRHSLRLRLSLDRLHDRRADLTGLALDLGYSSHSHFTMLFRRHFGVTPSEFRNESAARAVAAVASSAKSAASGLQRRA